MQIVNTESDELMNTDFNLLCQDINVKICSTFTCCYISHDYTRVCQSSLNITHVTLHIEYSYFVNFHHCFLRTSEIMKYFQLNVQINKLSEYSNEIG